MKVFIVSEKAYEVKQVKDFLSRLPYTQYAKDEPLAFYSEEDPNKGITRLTEEAAKGIVYDLIIVSQKMKTLSGLRFARSVTSREGIPATPVMLIVDGINKDVVKEAFAHGVSGFVELPFTAEGMQDALTLLALTTATREKKKLAQAMERVKGEDTFAEVLQRSYLQAAAVVRHAVSAAPWSKEAWLELADIYMQAGLHREAIPLVKQSLRIDFNNPEAHRMLLTCYKKTGQSPEEGDALKKMLAKNPNAPDLLIRTGETLLREGNFREAALFFKKAIIHLKPNDPKRLRARMHVGVGRSLAMEGDETMDPAKQEAAGEEFKKAIVTDPAMVSAYMNLIGVYKKLGMAAEAASLLSRAVKITPDSPEGWLDLFAMYLKDGELQKARFSLERAMQMDPENQITLVMAGEKYLHEQMYGEAAALFEKASAVNPSDTRIYNYLGITYRRMEMNVQAVEAFSKALKIDKEDCNLHFNLGRVYQQMGDAAKARVNYEAALKLNPELAEAAMALSTLVPGGAAARIASA